LRHNDSRTGRHHYHYEGELFMPFQTKPAGTIPGRTAFGAAQKYTAAEIADALTKLQAGQAVSDGVAFADRRKALNAASTLRNRVKKAAPNLNVRTTALPVEKGSNAGRFTWWVVPDILTPA
jgi:hypothetical protein